MTDLIKSSRVHFGVLVILTIALNAIIFQKFGIKVVSDSHRYLEWSQNPFSEFSATNWKFYSFGYVSFLSFSQWIGLGLKGVVIFQMLISSFALFLLYKLTYDISRSSIAAFIAAFLYLAFGEIVQWNTYILTESLFTSGIIVFMFLINRAQSWAQWLGVIGVGIFVCVTRPMGITVLLSAAIYLIYKFKLLNRLSLSWKVLVGLLALFTGCVLFYYLLEGNPSVNFYYSRGQIVWGTDTEELRKNTWLILGNENVKYPSKDLPSYKMFLVFVCDNFSFFTELFFKKSVLFVAHVKPYYSIWHNVYIVVFLGISYFFGFKGMFKHRKINAIAHFAFSLFVLTMLMVGLSVEAWEGRFLIPVLSPVFVFAATAIVKAFPTSKNFA